MPHKQKKMHDKKAKSAVNVDKHNVTLFWVSRPSITINTYQERTTVVAWLHGKQWRTLGNLRS